MTIYNRPRAEVFAENAPPSEIQPFQAWLRGLGIAFDETNGFPEMTGLNGLFNALNQYIKYLEQNGFAEWSADLEYPVGAGVRVGAVWYRAKTQNTNKTPATSQNDWELFLNASALSYSNPIYIQNNVIKVRDATTLQTGVTRYATSTEVANRSNVSAAVRPVDMPPNASATATGIVQFANTTDVANKNNVSKAINPANAATIAQSTDLGVGQTWQNVTGSRSKNTTYTNTTGRPIYLKMVIANNPFQSGVALIINSIRFDYSDVPEGSRLPIDAVIPPGGTYRFEGNDTIITWAELR